VVGKLIIKSGKREEFIEKSKEAIMQARQLATCVDFCVSADPVDPLRVNIFEKWRTRCSLEEFRKSGPADDSFSLVESFDIEEYEVNT